MAFNSIIQRSPARTAQFWRAIDACGPAECWPVKKPNHYGYKQVRVGKYKTTQAHRMAYELKVGPVPVDLCVCHRCDNRACCNPGHLFLGTKADNNRDRSAKRRSAIGSRSPFAVLSDEAIAEIKQLRLKGWTQQAIADKFGVQQPAIWKVLVGLTWAHLK